MDAYDCRALACVPSLPIAIFAVLHLYSTLSLPRRSKQTMIKQMDDWMDGWMDDETNGSNDASRHPLLYVM
jgi:hypothetical protein